MRYILLMLTAWFSISAHAAGDVIPFAGVQESCVQVGDITFGPGGHWANCRVTRGRWIATIDYLDLHQAQYCLGKNAETCDKRALVIFANRAYTPDAKVLLVRVDDGAMEYDDPLVVISDEENIMSISAHSAIGDMSKSFYLWRTDHWVPIDAQSWLQGMPALIPAGTSVRQSSSWPDIETMSAQVSLFQQSDADCCPSGGVANVELGLTKEQFTIKQVKVNAIAK